MVRPTDTKILAGEILLIAGICLSALAVLLALFFSSLLTVKIDTSVEGLNATAAEQLQRFTSSFLLLSQGIAYAAMAGIVAALLALWFALQRQLTKAGILAIIAALLPPLGLLQLIAGILFLLARQRKK